VTWRVITASLVAKSFFGRSGKSTNYVVQHDGIPSSMRIIWLFSLPLLRSYIYSSSSSSSSSTESPYGSSKVSIRIPPACRSIFRTE